jgi:hypothetical protein
MGWQPTAEAGELAAMVWGGDDSGRRRKNWSGITKAEWGPDLRVGGGEGLTGEALPMVARSAEGAHR